VEVGVNIYRVSSYLYSCLSVIKCISMKQQLGNVNVDTGTLTSLRYFCDFNCKVLNNIDKALFCIDSIVMLNSSLCEFVNAHKNQS